MPIQSVRSRAVQVLLALGLVLLVASATGWLPVIKAADKEIATDDLQRSLLLDTSCLSGCFNKPQPVV